MVMDVITGVVDGGKGESKVVRLFIYDPQFENVSMILYYIWCSSKMYPRYSGLGILFLAEIII